MGRAALVHLGEDGGALGLADGDPPEVQILVFGQDGAVDPDLLHFELLELNADPGGEAGSCKRYLARR